MIYKTVEKALKDKLAKVRQQGYTEGRQAALFEIAKAMSAKECPIDLISQVIGLPIADIKTILD